MPTKGITIMRSQGSVKQQRMPMRKDLNVMVGQAFAA
jgi:hypothetical protein